MISNSFEKEAEINSCKDPGLGVANLKRRLELVYPGRHERIWNISCTTYNQYK
jgi:hypothetical protein